MQSQEEPSTRAREAESPHRTPWTEAELRTSTPLGEDATLEERGGRSRERDDGVSLVREGNRGKEAAEDSMDRPPAGNALDGDGDVGTRSEEVEVGGAEMGDERAEGGDVRGEVRHGFMMAHPFEMGEFEHLRHIPSFRTGEREHGGAKTEEPAWEEEGQVTAGKAETDGGGASRGLRVAWWKMGFEVRETPSLSGGFAEEGEMRGGQSGRVMRRCVSVCVFGEITPCRFGRVERLMSDGRKNAVNEVSRYTICIRRSIKNGEDSEVTARRKRAVPSWIRKTIDSVTCYTWFFPKW